MLKSLSNTNLSIGDKVECHQRWYELISRYSRRSLTYKSDKLVAFSGIIDLIQKGIKLEFLAGLCNKTFIFDLLWATTSNVSSS